MVSDTVSFRYQYFGHSGLGTLALGRCCCALHSLCSCLQDIVQEDWARFLLLERLPKMYLNHER